MVHVIVLRDMKGQSVGKPGKEAPDLSYAMAGKALRELWKASGVICVFVVLSSLGRLLICDWRYKLRNSVEFLRISMNI